MKQERIDAIARGDKTYITSSQCRRGHDAPRYASNGSCQACSDINNEIARSGMLEHEQKQIQIVKCPLISTYEMGRRIS